MTHFLKFLNEAFHRPKKNLEKLHIKTELKRVIWLMNKIYLNILLIKHRGLTIYIYIYLKQQYFG